MASARDRRRSDSLVGQEVDGLFDFVNGGRVHDDVALAIVIERPQQSGAAAPPRSVSRTIAQIRAVKAGDIAVGRPQLELRRMS